MPSIDWKTHTPPQLQVLNSTSGGLCLCKCNVVKLQSTEIMQLYGYRIYTASGAVGTIPGTLNFQVNATGQIQIASPSLAQFGFFRLSWCCRTLGIASDPRLYLSPHSIAPVSPTPHTKEVAFPCETTRPWGPRGLFQIG